MSLKRISRELKKRGYLFKREGKKHEIWSNGNRVVIVSKGSRPNEQFLKRLKQ